VTLIHEHLRFRDEAVAENWPGRYEAQCNQVTPELLRRGQTERLLISQDFCATIEWFPEEAGQQMIDSGMIRNSSMTLVFEEVLPWLREQGVLDDAAFGTVFVQNPARWLAR
jgi:phosphotriesterase-related protein